MKGDIKTLDEKVSDVNKRLENLECIIRRVIDSVIIAAVIDFTKYFDAKSFKFTAVSFLMYSTILAFPAKAESYNKVCNRTALTVIYVNAFRQENTNKWTTQSGVNLAPGACANVYKASSSPWTAYYIAFGIGKKGVTKSAVWTAENYTDKGPRLCVFHFELSEWKISNQVNGSESSCKGDDLSMASFIKQSMKQNTTIELTLENAARQF